MRHIAQFMILASTVVILVAGCAYVAPALGDSRLTRQEAIAIANRAAIAQNEYPSAMRTKVSFHSGRGPACWELSYKPLHTPGTFDKEGRVYGGFSFRIFVDDKTGATEFIPTK